PPLLAASFLAPATTALSALSLHDALPIYDPEIAALFAEDFAILWSTKSIHAPEPDRDQCGPVISEPPTALTPLLVNINTATETEDRKSTRLNSSHVKISYAVFCLKKTRHI